MGSEFYNWKSYCWANSASLDILSKNKIPNDIKLLNSVKSRLVIINIEDEELGIKDCLNDIANKAFGFLISFIMEHEGGLPDI